MNDVSGPIPVLKLIIQASTTVELMKKPTFEVGNIVTESI